ncbi:hypothetical protein PVL29_024177 [Vitis rotundifolia]|uniref:Uncharacterized protein n=1 Tax=Vitis rotundifolia TaxID=103349 RepID=A0AA38YRA7_VITRO|nr:hypothetical protein PVL29_024177 [Vitis rotundifolia]
MEVEHEEMKSLGVFGIYRKAYKIILPWRKIFTQIILAYILPLLFISLVNTHLSNPLLPKIVDQEKKDLAETQVPTSSHTNIFDLLSFPFSSYWLFQASYTIYSFIFSLVSTSAIVYTMACIYSGREVTFRMVTSVVPKVGRRLLLTSFTIFLVVCTYHVVAFLVFALAAVLIAFGPNTNVGMSILLVVVVLYLMGLLYMSVVWQLASTISVLEDSYGFQAMKRSNQLIKGKVGVSTLIFLKLGLLHYVLQKALERVVVNGESLGMVNRVAYANVCFSLFLLVGLFERVIQTIIYFVCKSYHHERVDKLALSDHLQVYSQEYSLLLKGDNLDELKQLGWAILLCVLMVSKVAIVCLSRLLFLRICLKSNIGLNYKEIFI